MKFKDYITEAFREDPEDRGKTTKVHGHSHEYWLNHVSGDGSTSKDQGHTHKIKKMVVQPSNGHIHDLI
jgi:hypothetical protein